MSRLRNKELYDIAVEAEEWERLTVFAYVTSPFLMSMAVGWGDWVSANWVICSGTGVGLVKEVLPAEKIVEEVRGEAVAIIERLRKAYAS